MGDLLLLLTGRKRVPISSNVPVGRMYLLADFLTFDLAKVTRTELSPEETKLCQKLYETVDANRDGVLEVISASLSGELGPSLTSRGVLTA